MDAINHDNNIDAVTPNHHATGGEHDKAFITAVKAELEQRCNAPSAADDAESDPAVPVPADPAENGSPDATGEAEGQQPAVEAEAQEPAPVGAPQQEEEEEEGEEPEMRQEAPVPHEGPQVEADTTPAQQTQAAEETAKTEESAPPEEAIAIVAPHTPYPPMIGQAYENKKKANLNADEELVWWRLYMESTNRADPNSRAPRNVWTVQERELIENVSDAGLQEMRGRLLTLLSSVEYSLWERGHPVNGQAAPRAASAAHLPNSVASKPADRRAGSRSPRAASNGSPATTPRRRVMNERGEIARNSKYVPRSSVSEATPVKDSSVRAHSAAAEEASAARTRRTTAPAVPASPAATAAADDAMPTTPRVRSSAPRHSSSAVARGGPGGTVVLRGSSVGSIPPSLANLRRSRSTIAAQERPSFNLSFNNSTATDSQASEKPQPQTPRARRLPPTPRTARTDPPSITPKTLRTVPDEVHTKRLDTTNPLKRQAYVSVFKR